MSFGPRYTLDRFPIGVKRYLLPQERQVIAVRYHPAVLIWPVLAAGAACAAGSTITVFTGVGGTTLIAIWVAAATVCVFLVVRGWVWLSKYLVMTRHRVILVPGIIRHRMVSISMREISDIYLTRTLPGRLFGYGMLTLTPVREEHTAPVINYIPYPDDLYLEARRVLLGEIPN